jgi:adenylate cyclase class 2
MQEIEVKILEIDKKATEQKLIKLGAKKVFDGIVDSKVFDFPDERIKNRKDLLRVRMMGDECFLTYKIASKEKSKAKVCEEIEFKISDMDKMKLVLGHLGLNTKDGVKKHRTSYSIGSTHFEIEEYLEENKFVPCFLEIEAHGLEEIQKYAKLLGFKESECLNWNSWDVIDYYKNKKTLKK